MKQRQPDDEICSVNRTSQEVFFFKNHTEKKARKLFFKKA